MGRPLNKKYFGANSKSNIKVQFYNGTASVKGYIVKQLGTKKFRCKDADGNVAICRLVDKASADLAAGEMTISLKNDAGVVQQATKISGHLVSLVYSGTNYVTGGTHNSSLSIGQGVWSYSTSTSDTYWQIEEAGTNAAMDNSVDLEGDDFDTTYPIPGSGTFKTAATAFTGISYSVKGSVTTATGGITTVANSADGLLRSKYDGNLATSPGDALSTWNFSFFSTATHLADVADTYVSWGQQSDGNVLGQQNFSMEWKGYVKVPTTQNWNFYSQSDDDNVVWIGSTALSGYNATNYSNWNSNNAMPNDVEDAPQNTLSMDSTKWYPVRIWMTEYNGGCNFQIFAIGADGTKLNGSDLQWAYNTATGGYNP